MIKLMHNLDELTAGLDSLERRELPYALSAAMNATAFDVRKHTVETVWPKNLTARNKRFAAIAIKVSKKAQKTDLDVMITDTLGRDAFSRQADGEVRRPVGSHRLSVPGKSIKRLTGGAVPKSMRPKAALEKKRVFKAKNLILQRVGKKKVRILYVLATSARVEKHFDAYTEAEMEFVRRMPAHFDRVMTYAVNKSIERMNFGRYRSA